MQCCGEPIEIGSQVQWRLEAPDRDFATAVLGDEVAVTITHAEEHHSGTAAMSPPTSGTVKSIRAVWCRYAPVRSAVGESLYPLAGSAEIGQLSTADGWETENDDLRFVAYLVELDDANAPLPDA